MAWNDAQQIHHWGQHAPVVGPTPRITPTPCALQTRSLCFITMSLDNLPWTCRGFCQSLCCTVFFGRLMIIGHPMKTSLGNPIGYRRRATTICRKVSWPSRPTALHGSAQMRDLERPSWHIRSSALHCRRWQYLPVVLLRYSQHTLRRRLVYVKETSDASEDLSCQSSEPRLSFFRACAPYRSTPPSLRHPDFVRPVSGAGFVGGFQQWLSLHR